MTNCDEIPNLVPMDVRVNGWKVINPQLASPLFSRIPAEIQGIIFDFALAETPAHPNAISRDLGVRYYHGPAGHEEPRAIQIADWEPWLRPDVAGPTHVSYELLRACRRIYLETAQLPVLDREIVMYQFGGSPPWINRHGARALKNLEKTLASHHAAGRTVRRLRIFSDVEYVVGSFPLPGAGSFPQAMLILHAQSLQDRIVSGIQTLRITIRSDNWVAGKLRHMPFSFDPFVNNRSLARVFPIMTNLSTLIVDFESGEDRRAQLEELVDKARGWRFLVFSNPPPPVVTIDEARGGWLFPTNRSDMTNYNPYDLVKDNLMATMKGENGEPARWHWLTTEGNKTEIMSYDSSLPIRWNRSHRYVGNTWPGNLEKNRTPRMVAFTVTWTAKTRAREWKEG